MLKNKFLLLARLHPALPTALTMHRATHSALPTASSAASRLQEMDTCQGENAMQPLSVAPTGCPPERPDWRHTDGLACPCLRRFGLGSSGPINSRCASFNKSNRFLLMKEVHQITTSRGSHQLEAEPIY